MASVREWEDVSREAKRREGSRWKDVLRGVHCGVVRKQRA